MILTGNVALRLAQAHELTTLSDSGCLFDTSRLRNLPLERLVVLGRELGLDNAQTMRRHDLVMAIARLLVDDALTHVAEGCLDTHEEGFGFLRLAEHSYLPGPYDVYVSPSQIRRFNLRKGDTVYGRVRPPREGERFYALLELEKVGGVSPEESAQ